MFRAVLAAVLLFATAAFAGTPRYDVDVIGPMEGESLAGSFAQLLSAPGPEVAMRINSPGGSVFTTLLFIDLARDEKAKRDLHVTCVGTVAVASAAALLFESEVCDVRVLEPATVVLFHGVSGSGGGKQEEQEDNAAFTRALNRSLAMIIAPRLQMTVDAYLAWIAGRDRTLTSDVCVELHVADRVEVWRGHAAPKPADAAGPL